MKKILFSFVGLIFAAFSVQAQDAAPQPQANPNAPEISFEKTVHDYGTIFQSADGTCEFKFTNTGKEPLILSKPQSSCGCTVPTWPQEPILPGKSDVIKVTYNTNNIGPINKTVTVTSNAKTSRIVLQIKGAVVAKPATTEPVKTTDQGASPQSK
ncbi:MAG: DUF1573 domain-containing protein [Bacteroidales bacterium]|jgi:hypothetical protein|nr:DUF1573 domain-containing protein [Bacteroidales bacterium]